MNEMALLGTEFGQSVFSAAWPRTVVSSCAGPVRRAHLPEAMAAMRAVRARMNGAGGSSASVAGLLGQRPAQALLGRSRHVTAYRACGRSVPPGWPRCSGVNSEGKSGGSASAPQSRQTRWDRSGATRQ